MTNHRSNPAVALVTGGNRGLGREVCKQLALLGYQVLLTARDSNKGQQASDELSRETGYPVRFMPLDVTDPSSVDRLAAALIKDSGSLDVLVNNAGALYDSGANALSPNWKTIREALEINAIGPWYVLLAFLPLLKNSLHPRIVNVSSEGGSLASMTGGTPGYSMSKAGLNATTRMLSALLRADRILVNSVCPGWVATEMGGFGGRPIFEGARGIVWAATLPDDGPTGGFFRDQVPLPW